MRKNNLHKEIEAQERAEKLLGEIRVDEDTLSPDYSLTDLIDLGEAYRTKRRNRKLKYIGAVAAILLVFGVVAYVTWDQIFPAVDAGKNEKQVVTELENGDIMINEENGNAEITDDATITTRWSQIEKYHKKYSELIVPTYVPTKYTFKDFKISEISEDERIFDFRFTGAGEKVLDINQWKQDGAVFHEHKEIIFAGAAKVYITEIDKKELTASLVLGDQVVTISGNITKSELRKIVKGLQ